MRMFGITYNYNTKEVKTMESKVEEEKLLDKICVQYRTLKRLTFKSKKELKKIKRSKVNLDRADSCHAFSEWVLQRCLESIAHAKGGNGHTAYVPMIELTTAIQILKVARNRNLINDV